MRALPTDNWQSRMVSDPSDPEHGVDVRLLLDGRIFIAVDDDVIIRSPADWHALASARVVEMQNTEERPEDAARRMARQIQELRDLIARRDGIIRGLREEITELKAGVTSQVAHLAPFGICIYCGFETANTDAETAAAQIIDHHKVCPKNVWRVALERLVDAMDEARGSPYPDKIAALDEAVANADAVLAGVTPKMVMQDDLRDRVERLAAWQSKLIFPTNNKNDADRLLQEVIMEAARLSEALLAAFPLDSVSKEPRP